MTTLPPIPGEPTDADLVAAIHAGRAAIANIVRRHSPMVYAYLGKMRLPPTVDQEDVAQEGLIALTRAAETWKADGRSKFSTYAFVCVTNAMRRTAGIEATRTSSLNAHPLTHETCEYMDLIPAPEPPAIPERIHERLPQLHPLHRQILILHFGLEGEPLGMGAIADLMGLSVPQTRTALQMALKLI